MERRLAADGLSPAPSPKDASACWILAAGGDCVVSFASAPSARALPLYTSTRAYSLLWRFRPTQRRSDRHPVNLIFDVDKPLLASQDIVLGADICYRHALISLLLGLVERDRRRSAADRRSGGPLSSRSGTSPLTLGAWETDEQLIAWSGQRPTIRGRVADGQMA